MKRTNNPDFTMSKKVRRLAVRVARTPFGPTKKKFCYVHVPKCGGNSVALAFINGVPIMRNFTWVPVVETRKAVSIAELGHINEAHFHDDGPHSEKVYALRRQMACVALVQGHDYVGGHFLFDCQAHEVFSNTYAFVTILRDPVARLISHYREERRSGFVDTSLEDYLSSPMAKVHATMITRYLAGWTRNTLVNEEAATEAALANIEKFAVIGFMNNLSNFEKRVTMLSGKSFALGHSRSAVVSKPDVDEVTLARIRALCQSDIAVYTRAHELFAG